MREREDLRAAIGLPTRRQLVAGVVGALGGVALGRTNLDAGIVEEISHSAESIHQEPVFMASRKRVYQALTDAKQFHRVVLRMQESPACLRVPRPRRSVQKSGAVSPYLAVISWDDTSNFFRTSESFKHGERVVGSLECTRSRNS